MTSAASPAIEAALHGFAPAGGAGELATGGVDPADGAPRPHPRIIGWKSASAIAMGGSNQSLFVIGSLLATQGSAAIPLLVAGLILSWMAIPGWIELTLMWPDRVGGIAAVCAEAFRPYSAVLANLTGVCYWWGWVPTCAITATLASSALHSWYLPQVPVVPMALAMIAAMTVLNLCGLKWAARIAAPMAIVSGLPALLSGLIPVFAGTVDWHRAASFHLILPFHGLFGGITSAMAGLYIVGFAAPAFEAAACHLGEMRDPVRDQPRAMYASALAATVYFVLLPVVWLGVFGAGPLQGDLGRVLGPSLAPVFGSFARAGAVWFIVLSLLHGTLQPLSGATRTLLQLAEDGLLPRSFARRMRRTDAPWVAIIVTALAAAGVAIDGAPVWIIAAANLTYLIGICLPSVAVWLMRRDAPTRPRPYRARRGTVGLGLFAAVVWLISTLLGFEQYGLPTVLCGLAFAYAGSLGYLWRVVGDRRRAGIQRRRGSLHAKLTGSMLAVIAFDGAGYLLAIAHVHHDPALRTALQDIFVGVALLTISVGLVLPGMIGQSASELARAADRLATGTVADLGRALLALATGNLDEAYARKDFEPLGVYSNDELGEMARSFNAMHREVAAIADTLDEARDGVARANNELARFAAEQASLARAEFEARQAIERANRAKSEFLSRVSHELRTPLNAILGFGQLLQLGELDEEQRSSVEYILRGGDHLLALVDDLLEISRIESAPAATTLEPVDLQELVEEAVALVMPSTTATGVTISTRFGTARWVQAERQQLAQVMLNLLSNAIKYNRAAGSVTVTTQAAGDVDVTISVRDTGCGIEPELLDRLYTPFDRLGAEQTKVQGTGLGLALAKRAVEAMSGALSVTSTPGRGSTFTVTLQRAESPRAPEDLEPQPDDRADSDRRRVLYIEDNAPNRALVEQLLAERDGFELITSETAAAGLALAHELRPDLLLLDLNLPDAHGEDVLDALREHEARSEIPVVVLSADASPDRARRAIAGGARACLAKPIKVAELFGEIDRALASA
jgi:signal transduction histidine kinase/ActR/RegA family two-component response regulator